jgi:chemotaxis protein methyltransferase CheR
MENLYRQFYDLLEKNVGIQLDQNKQYLVDSRLVDLAKSTGQQTVPALLKHILNTPAGPLHWQAFEAMTTNETLFFRDKSFFDALSNVILPKLIEARSAERSLRIFCAAASTGQEPYSLAMLIRDRFSQLNGWDIYIQASDISEKSLSRARLGVYSQREVERGLEPDLLRRYFSKTSESNYEISPAIRALVNFSRHNLLDEGYSYPKFDLVLLRNVLIYFGAESKDRILKNVHRQIAADHGLLLLGATESLIGYPHFKLAQAGKISTYAPV